MFVGYYVLTNVSEAISFGYVIWNINTEADEAIDTVASTHLLLHTNYTVLEKIYYWENLLRGML